MNRNSNALHHFGDRKRCSFRSRDPTVVSEWCQIRGVGAALGAFLRAVRPDTPRPRTGVSFGPGGRRSGAPDPHSRGRARDSRCRATRERPGRASGASRRSRYAGTSSSESHPASTPRAPRGAVPDPPPNGEPPAPGAEA
jgi:hypothetical protein